MEENYGADIDTLKVVTIYGPTSYFDYRGEFLGVDYENVRRFAKDGDMELEIQVVSNIGELIEKLENGEAHLGAYPVPSISEYKGEIVHCGPRQISWQVLVQKNSPEKIKDVTELTGKEIVVEENSKYHFRLKNLDSEIGGGINILPIESDTLQEEDFLDMVSRGDISYTVVDSETANLNSKYYTDLDFSLHVSLDQAASWVVGPGLDSLVAKIDRWEQRNHDSDIIKEIYKRYYERGKIDPLEQELAFFKSKDISKTGKVSPYDDLFKTNSQVAGFDWELLAAIAYCESRFIPDVTSRFGATGLMQVMPSTANALGFQTASLINPAINVKAASKLISNLNETLKKKVEDPEERMKFVIASYNSGLGHIYDSMTLAEKNGLDPQKWLGNVSVAVLMKSRPEYYTDPDMRHGYFRGRETVEFVDRVMAIYDYIKSQTKS